MCQDEVLLDQFVVALNCITAYKWLSSQSEEALSLKRSCQILASLLRHTINKMLSSWEQTWWPLQSRCSHRGLPSGLIG